jgi:hypothetical protein
MDSKNCPKLGTPKVPEQSRLQDGVAQLRLQYHIAELRRPSAVKQHLCYSGHVEEQLSANLC